MRQNSLIYLVNTSLGFVERVSTLKIKLILSKHSYLTGFEDKALFWSSYVIEVVAVSLDYLIAYKNK